VLNPIKSIGKHVKTMNSEMLIKKINEKNVNPMAMGVGMTNRLIHNIPYLATILLGAVVLYFSFDDSLVRILLAGAFILYGILSTIWFMMFLCVHCHSYGSQKCHSGFGLLAAKLKKRGNPALFRSMFKRHIGVVFPSWFVPLIVGIVSLAYEFTLPKVVLISLFVINSFFILPLASKNRGCSDCPQRSDCPWIKEKE